MTDLLLRLRLLGLALALGLCAAPCLRNCRCAAAARARRRCVIRGTDLQRRLHRRRGQQRPGHRRRGRAAHSTASAPPACRAARRSPPVTEQMRQQALDSLIEERVILTYARDSGMRVDDAEIDRAVQSVAAQNQLTLAQLRERLRADGIDYARFRTNLRDQILMERVREREVGQRTRVLDADIDKYLAERNAVNATRCRAEHRADPGHRARRRQPRGAGAASGAGRRGAGARARRRGLRRRGARGVGRRQSCPRRRDRPAPGVAAARPVRRAGARPAARRGVAHGAAQRRRPACAEADRAARQQRRARHADAGAPHPAAPVGAAQRRGGAAAAVRHARANRTRQQQLREPGAPVLRGRLGRPGRRPRLGQPRRLRARVRGGDEPPRVSAAFRSRWYRASACT